MTLYVLKLGGSVITEKQKNIPRAKKPVIKRIAKEILKAREEKNFSLILTHGVGPFGHKLVKDYSLNNGIKTIDQKKKFVETHLSVSKLNNLVSEIFNNEGISSISMPPIALAKQRGKKLDEFSIDVTKGLIKLYSDLVPVFYGDMVLDKKLGASVLSGDVIVPHLAQKLKASKVFLGTDVNGIFFGDPKVNSNAELIHKITSKNFKKIISEVEHSKTVDVTKGMKGKLEALKCYMKNQKGVIFNLNKKNSLYNLLVGKNEVCTKIDFTK